MEKFIAHGVYSWSNCCGYEVQISDCGDAARLRYPKGDDFVITDWLEIEYVGKEDSMDEDDQFHPVIDPNHFNVPLNLVMKI